MKKTRDNNKNHGRAVFKFLPLIISLAAIVVFSLFAVQYSINQRNIKKIQETQEQINQGIETAISQLDDESETVRVEALGELTRLAEFSPGRQAEICEYVSHFTRETFEKQNMEIADKKIKGRIKPWSDLIAALKALSSLNESFESNCTADLHNINAEKIKLDLDSFYFRKANLSKANLSGVDLDEADLTGASLREATLSKTDMDEANLSGADLWYADLSGADLDEANLSGADLRYATLSAADLDNANLSGTDLRYANLSDTDLEQSKLNGADLRNAVLYDADLDSTDLSGADLRNADLSEIETNDKTIFKGVTINEQTLFDTKIYEKYVSDFIMIK